MFETLIVTTIGSALVGGAAFLWPRFKHLGIVGKADRLVRSFFLPNSTWRDALTGRNYRKTMPSNITTYTYSLTELARKGLLKPIHGREEFVSKILGQFQSDKRFLIMTGRAGSGKTALMERVAAEMATNPQFSTWEVRMLRVSELKSKLSVTSMADIAAGGTAARVLRELINEVVEENMQGKRIALFIDEFLSVANCNVFSEFKGPLSDGNLPIFGALTHQEFVEKNVMNSVAGSDEAMRRRVSHFELPQFDREDTFAACRVRLEGAPHLPQELFAQVQSRIGTCSIQLTPPSNAPSASPRKSVQVTISQKVVEACAIMGASLETHPQRKLVATHRLINTLAYHQACKGGGELSLESAWNYLSAEQSQIAYTRQIELLTQYIWPLTFDEDALWYAYLEGHRDRPDGVDPDVTLNCLTTLVNQIRSRAIQDKSYGPISITLESLLAHQFGRNQAEIERAKAQLARVQGEERALGGILTQLLKEQPVQPSSGSFPELITASFRDFQDIFADPFSSTWQGLAIQGSDYAFYGLRSLVARDPNVLFYTLDLGFFQQLVVQAQREAATSEFREIRMTAAQKLTALQQQLKGFLLTVRAAWQDSRPTSTLSSSSYPSEPLPRPKRPVLLLKLPASFLKRIEESCGTVAEHKPTGGGATVLTTQAGTMVNEFTRGVQEMASPITSFLESQFNFNIRDLLNTTSRITPSAPPTPSEPGAPAPTQVEADLWQLPVLSGLLGAMSAGLIPYLVQVTGPIPEETRAANGAKLVSLSVGSEEEGATLLHALFGASKKVCHAALLIAKEQGHEGDAQVDAAGAIIQKFTQSNLQWESFLRVNYPQDYRNSLEEGEIRGTSLFQQSTGKEAATSVEKWLSRNSYSTFFAELYSRRRPTLFVLESSPVRRELIKELISNSLFNKDKVSSSKKRDPLEGLGLLASVDSRKGRSNLLFELDLRRLERSSLSQERQITIVEEQLREFRKKLPRRESERVVLIVDHSPLLASERIRPLLNELAALKSCSLVYFCNADQFHFPGQQSAAVASAVQVGGPAPAANPLVSVLEKGAQFLQNPMAALNGGALTSIVEAGKNLLSESQPAASPPLPPSESTPPVEQLSGKKPLFIQSENYRSVSSGPIKKEEIEWVVNRSAVFAHQGQQRAKEAFIKLVEWEGRRNPSFKLDDVQGRLDAVQGHASAQEVEITQRMVLDFYHKRYPNVSLDELKDTVDPNLTSTTNKIQRQTIGKAEEVARTVRNMVPPHVVRGAIYMAAVFYIPKMVYRGIEGLYSKIDEIFTGSIKG